MPEPKQSENKQTQLPRFGPGPRHMPGQPVEKAKDTKGSALRIWHYLQKQGMGLLLVVILVIIATGLSLLGPLFMGQAVDRAMLKGNLPLLAKYALLLLVVYGLASLVNSFQTYIMAKVAQNTIRDLRNDLFYKMQTLPLRFFDGHSHGELMSRLTNDIDNINNVLNEGVTQFIASMLTIIGVVAMMLIINIRLALVSMVTIPFMVLITKKIAAASLKGFRDQQQALGALNGIIEESITGERVIKAYVREESVIANFEVENRKLQAASTRAQILAGNLGPLMNMVNNISFAIVAGVGGWMAVQGLATIGAITAFVNYARQFSQPLNQIANLYNSIQSALAGAERVFAIIDETPEIEDAIGALELGNVQGDVCFDNVSFAYEEGTPVLEHVSFHALPGQTIALVGPTGAGKTTIVNLLSRFYEIQDGTIRVDDHDIRDIKKNSLRQTLGTVLQDSFLFSDTVMENIRYGRLSASDEEVIAAATLANADGFIQRLPQKYNTTLTERGSNISQGQRQLLAIARAILADPGILVLDEATSNVDTRTEMHIQEAMLRLMKGRTSFVIAHRLSTIREADQILVINHGRVIENGTHKQLLLQDGFYKHLYMSQFKGQAVTVPEYKIKEAVE